MSALGFVPGQDWALATSSRFVCDLCGRAFSRPSHLTRHCLTHLPRADRILLPCIHCGRSFSRRDILVRHLRVAHEILLGPKPTKQKSCHRCVRSKIKCDRALPCGSCAASGAPESCSYPSSDFAPRTDLRLVDYPSGTPAEAGDSPPPALPWGPGSLGSSGFGPWSAAGFPAAGQAVALGTQGYYGPVVPPSAYTGAQAEFRGTGLDWLDFDAPGIGLDGSVAPYTMPALGCGPAVPVPCEPAGLPRPGVLPWPKPLSATHWLMQLLSCQQQLPLSGPADDGMTAGMEMLRQFVDMYLSGFQAAVPILHMPTWNMAECPTILLTTMVCIGSASSGEPSVLEFSDSMGEFSASMMSWLGVSEESSYADVSYLAALCLHRIYCLGSGKRQLYPTADRARAALASSLRGLGVADPQAGAAEDGGPTASDPSTLHAGWVAWASREKGRRIAWASFENDSSMCTLANQRGGADLSALPARLPCSESLWEAPSAYAWASLMYRSPPWARGAPLWSVLRAAMVGEPLTEHVSMWGKRLCAQIIGRLLRDLRRLETGPEPEAAGLPGLFQGHQQPTVSLLRGLDTLLVYTNEPSSVSGLVSYNVSSLLRHYAYMSAPDDMMDMIVYIVQNVVSRGPCCDRRLDLARMRLGWAFEADPQRARKLLWHAGQIVAVANEGAVAVPSEMTRLLMAYLVVVAYVKYGRQAESAAGPGIRLDAACCHADKGEAVAEWISHGGPAQMGSASSIYARGAAAAIARDARLAFQQLRPWGMADKFARILQQFEANEK